MTVLDIHAHFEPRMFEVKPMRAQMASHGVDKVVLIPTMNDPLPETPAGLLGFVRALMCSPAHSLANVLQRAFMKDGNLKLQGKIYEIYSEPDNSQVAAVLRAHPELFVGWIFLNPRATTDQLQELERWRSEPGYIGVKLHPHWHGWEIQEGEAIFRRCEELGLPILIHLGFGRRGEWQWVAEKFPKLRMIFAHAGMPHFQRAWKKMRDYPNLSLDLSSPYLDEALARRAVAAVGPERALYGTDAPYGFHAEHDHNVYDYSHIKGWVERLPISSGEIDRVLGANAGELLEL
jgi:predicted TIM-barrel fold metal-dependent hydrolase